MENHKSPQICFWINSETHMIDLNHKHNKNIIFNHVWFHHTAKIKIIL